MSNILSTEYEDVIVRFFSRKGDSDKHLREVFDKWRKEKHHYNKEYIYMENL